MKEKPVHPKRKKSLTRGPQAGWKKNPGPSAEVAPNLWQALIYGVEAKLGAVPRAAEPPADPQFPSYNSRKDHPSLHG